MHPLPGGTVLQCTQIQQAQGVIFGWSAAVKPAEAAHRLPVKSY